MEWRDKLEHLRRQHGDLVYLKREKNFGNILEIGLEAENQVGLFNGILIRKTELVDLSKVSWVWIQSAWDMECWRFGKFRARKEEEGKGIWVGRSIVLW